MKYDRMVSMKHVYAVQDLLWIQTFHKYVISHFSDILLDSYSFQVTPLWLIFQEFTPSPLLNPTSYTHHAVAFYNCDVANWKETCYVRLSFLVL